MSAHAVDGIEASVVKLNVTKREPDFFKPWTKAAPSKVSGSGAVIDGKRILTNAHVVMFASQVLVQLRQGGDQYAGKVTAIAPGMDLALVELDRHVEAGFVPGFGIGERVAAAQVAHQRLWIPNGRRRPVGDRRHRLADRIRQLQLWDRRTTDTGGCRTQPR